MSLFRRFFYRKPPDRLLQISDRIYVFDSCFSTEVLDVDAKKVYLDGVVAQLQDCYPDASFMVFNFRDGDDRSQLSDLLSEYNMTVMNYPWQYEGFPLLPLEMILHFLRSSESWLSLMGQQNVLLMHCDRGGWPLLAFLLAALLLYRKQYTGEQKTLKMVHKRAPMELLHLIAFDPRPSQLRYLWYISSRYVCSDSPPSVHALVMDCIVLRVLPQFDGGRGFCPLVRVYGQDPSSTASRSSELLFSNLRTTKKFLEGSAIVKLDIQQCIQGDVVLECVHLDDDFESEKMVFRVMFHTSFIQKNMLMLSTEDVDVLWNAKDMLPKNFRVEVLFSDDAVAPIMKLESEGISETERALPPTLPPPPPPPPPVPSFCPTPLLRSAQPPPPLPGVRGAPPPPGPSRRPASAPAPWGPGPPGGAPSGRRRGLVRGSASGSEFSQDWEYFFSSAVDEKVHDVSHMPINKMSLAASPDIGEMVVSLSDEEEAIIGRLMRGSPSRDIVSIVGMGGIGKTTLAKKVYDDPKITHHFHRRAWCSVSQLYGKMEMLLDIIKDIQGLSDEIHQMSDTDLEQLLFRKLKRVKYLIVMDDLWDIKALDELIKSFPDDGVGSRILITSRFHNLAVEAKPDSAPHMLRPLSDDESLNLLEMKAFPEGGRCPEELLEIGKEIARLCKGLPLAVVAVAGILRRTVNDRNQWEIVAESLSSTVNADPETRCKSILEVSYMHLPSHLKSCFLYFGAFSENREVPVSKLIRLWIAEGFISSHGSKSLEETAENLLMDLINGSLVMISKRRSNGRVKACRIHGLLRDLCLSKAQEENFLRLISRNDEPYASFDRDDYGSDFYDFYPSDPVTFDSQRLCMYLKRKHFVSSTPSGPSTSSLILSACNDTYPRRPYNVSFICHNFKLLRVLDLECINMGMYLPSEIDLLVDLRYLAVSGDIESIPRSIANLRWLETLIVKGLSGKVILPDTIWSMASFRHLHVNSYAVFTLPDDHSENSSFLNDMVSLSTLSLSYEESEKILARLPNIRKLICVVRESCDDSSKKCNKFPVLDMLKHLESLEIVYFGRTLNSGGFSFPSNLKKLVLSHFRLPWNQIGCIATLPNLEVLKLLYGAFEGLMWEMNEDEFCKLRFLKLDTLNIAEWSASYEHLPELEQLVIRNCKNLEEVPLDLCWIPTLQTIEVQGCNRSLELSVRKIEEEAEGIKVVIT